MKSERYFQAISGKTFVTPNNQMYSVDYTKQGRKIIPIIVFEGNRMQVSMYDYCNTPTDILIDAIKKELTLTA